METPDDPIETAPPESGIFKKPDLKPKPAQTPETPQNHGTPRDLGKTPLSELDAIRNKLNAAGYVLDENKPLAESINDLGLIYIQHGHADQFNQLRKDHQNWIPDLRGLQLIDAKLQSFNFKGANFRDALLPGAEFINCDLSGADLSYANLSGANIRGCDLEATILDNVDLSSCKFS